ncbi:shikimate dehydrogenase [Dethiothermospora halolimnae]|uniref:shikimate dehydrogenase n=1 Tax=Dethiothermospora halolimnae TaxID=3114390 RepID=UPI003CCC2613
MKSLYGLIGEKLGHSFSPQIHGEIFKKLNISGYYHLFEMDKGDLKDGIKGMKALKIKGVNVTIPYKIDVMSFLDDLSIEAEKIGAINTICFQDNKAIGYNTDYYGFGMMLKRYGINVKNKSVVVLGTGGVTKAVLQYLSDEESKEVVLVSRNVDRAKDKIKGYTIVSYEELKNFSKRDIVINATPCGMYPKVDYAPVGKDILSKFNIAIDLIYNPEKTLFLKWAIEEGLKVVNGLYMLVGQAIKAQELWNNMQIQDSIVEEIYKEISNKISKTKK